MTGLGCLALASAAFVGSHLLMSHPLRPGLVRLLGERGFALAYTVVAIGLLYLMTRYYGAAADEAPALLWDLGQAGWIVATLLMWLGSVLFIGSLRRNPAFPRPGRPVTKIDEARGVYAITRHPMMWGFALWALVHAMVVPNVASLIVSAAIGGLALVGAAGQDAKKGHLIGEPWIDYRSRTSFAPFGRGLASPGTFAFIGGTLLWLAATWAHGALGYRPAGIWAFLS
ncbi:MAG TPA: NnrU family protein [Sphingomicrobium sp.]|nr:NnrU family protein [Sphingomicrobium sp.]